MRVLCNLPHGLVSTNPAKLNTKPSNEIDELCLYKTSDYFCYGLQVCGLAGCTA